MNPMTDEMAEKFGIPFIYHIEDLLNFKTIAMTMLDIKSLKDKSVVFFIEG